MNRLSRSSSSSKERLAAVGVLELVHHQQLQALRPRPAHTLVALQQVPRAQLEVVEVERGARALELRVVAGEPLQRLAQHSARPDGRQLRGFSQRVGRSGVGLGGIERGRRVERREQAGGVGQRGPARPTAAELGVHAQHHPPHPVRAVGGEHVHGLPVALARE